MIPPRGSGDDRRGGDERSGELFSYVELGVVRRDHPLRGRAVVNEALARRGGVWGAVSLIGRPSIPPERFACCAGLLSIAGTF